MAWGSAFGINHRQIFRKKSLSIKKEKSSHQTLHTCDIICLTHKTLTTCNCYCL